VFILSLLSLSLSLSSLKKEKAHLKKENISIGWTNGCFCFVDISSQAYYFSSKNHDNSSFSDSDNSIWEAFFDNQPELPSKSEGTLPEEE
jgi:hypothetical protein